ncbi:RNA polymerase sigma factor [Aestuariivivens insulae]|uniref:RNA polymerase sigma factor n=1 Tax=Aestuariivivens insulae TaxID=1621988 RepID=UPI001F56762D|nr:sigma-70 family RNA polymerase sigma factor [Aestuariivivens insulae]
MNKKERIIDGKLVVEFQRGNNQALVALVKRWHKTFCDKAYWIVKDLDTAKDIAQDCWQIIIEHIDKLKDPNSFGAWAMRIVYTKSIDVLKAVNKANTIQNQLKQEQDTFEEYEVSNVINIQQDLLKLINKLPEQQQLVVRLFYVQEYSLKEIGDMLGISVGTAKSRLFHAREKLKIILKQKNYEND